MRLQIVRIADRGVANQERLHLRALADTNLQYFVVLHTVYQSSAGGLVFPWTPSMLVNRFPLHTYWFGSRDVKAGDHILLYTGPGSESQEPTPDGHMNHFFRWGLPQTIWADANSCAVVMEIGQWETTPYGA